METDRNLLFGVLAVQLGLINADQFAEACTIRSTRKLPCRLVDILEEHKLISAADVAHINYLVERNLEKHGGDLAATLVDVPDDVKRQLASINDPDLHKTLGTPAHPIPSLANPPESIEVIPERRQRYKIPAYTQ